MAPRSTMPLFALALLGCGPQSIDSGGLVYPDTGQPLAPPVDTRCWVEDDQPQFIQCTAGTAEPDHVTFRLTPVEADAAPERAASSDIKGRSHALTWAILPPGTEFEWEARTDAGEVTTGLVSTGDPGLTTLVDIEGVSTTPYLLFSAPCTLDTRVVIADTTNGTVVWDFDLTGMTGQRVEATSWSEDHTLLNIVGNQVIETTLLGETLREVNTISEFGRRPHHDVFRRDGRTYVLYSESVEYDKVNHTLDGVFTLDEDFGLVDNWALKDHWSPPAAPTQVPLYGNVDTSHANSVWADAEGDLYVSFRHLSSVIQIEHSDGDPDYGSIRWALSGDPNNQALPTDLLLTSALPEVDPSFVRQHNAHLMPDGTLSILDNRLGTEEMSRYLNIALDPGSQQAEITTAVDLPEHCPFQGGAWSTPAGNPLLTCAPTGNFYEYDLANPTEPVWSASAKCAGPPTYVPRGVPLTIPDEVWTPPVITVD